MRKFLFSLFLLLCLTGLSPALQADESPQEKIQGLMTFDCPDLLHDADDRDSRSYAIVKLTPEHPQCRIDGIIGGEHISYIGITGAAFPWYTLEIIPVSGDPVYGLEWPDTAPQSWSKDFQKATIGPLAEPGFILAFSAHPVASYRIQVRGFETPPAHRPEEK